MSDKMSQAEIDALLKQMQAGIVTAETINKLTGDEYICLKCHRIIGISTHKSVKQKDVMFLNKCGEDKHKYINIEFLKQILKDKGLL